MTAPKSPPSRPQLLAIAISQAGYFTSQQAASAGYATQHLNHHRKAGNFQSISHGLYRFAELPVEEDEDLICRLMQVRDRSDRLRATLSHETALAQHGLSDHFAGRIHFTVPPGFRGRVPEDCVVHRTPLGDDERHPWKVGSITTPLRTVHDLSKDDGFSTEQLALAIDEGIERGLFSKAAVFNTGNRRLRELLPTGRE